MKYSGLLFDLVALFGMPLKIYENHGTLPFRTLRIKGNRNKSKTASKCYGTSNG